MLDSFNAALLADQIQENHEKSGPSVINMEAWINIVLRRANRAENLTDSLSTIVDSVMEFFNFDGGAAYIFRNVDNRLDQCYKNSFPQEIEGITELMEADPEFCKQLMDDQRTLLSKHQRPFTLNSVFSGPFVLSVTLPLAAGKKRIGVLQFLSGKRNGVSDEEERALKALAGECAILAQRLLKLEQAHNNEKNLYHLFDSISDMVLTLDGEGRILSANEKAAAVLGLGGKGIRPGAHFRDFYPPQHQEQVSSLIENCISQGQDRGCIPIVGANGNVILTETYFTRASWYEHLMVFALCRDIKENNLDRNEQSVSDELYRHLFEQATDGIFIYDRTGRLVAFNRTITDLTGYDASEIENKFLCGFIIPEHQQMARETLKRQGDTTQAGCMEVGIIAKDGRRIDMEISSSPVNGFNNGPLMQGIARDITERKKSEEKLRYLSLHDGLTGLYNRNFFDEEMKAMESGSRDPVGIILCDVDGLKMVNDYFGHQAGDELLRQAAGIIKNCFRDCDIVARIGGDEFCVLLPDTEWNGVKVSLRRLERAVEVYNRRSPAMPVSMSKGCAVRHVRIKTLKETLQEADERMYQDKMNNHARFNNYFVKLLRNDLE